jgi:CheY-like chemotaxis protein
VGFECTGGGYGLFCYFDRAILSKVTTEIYAALLVVTGDCSCQACYSTSHHLAFRFWHKFKQILASSRPVRVMLMHWELEITAVYKKYLEMKGAFQVDTFNDPLEALARYKPSSYDIILTDTRLPKINGFDFVQDIRRIDKQVRIVFFSAFELCLTDIQDWSRKHGLDIDGYVRLPMPLQRLTDVINSVVANDYTMAAPYFCRFEKEVGDKTEQYNRVDDGIIEGRDAKHGTGYGLAAKLYQAFPFVFLYLLLVML